LLRGGGAGSVGHDAFSLQWAACGAGTHRRL